MRDDRVRDIVVRFLPDRRDLNAALSRCPLNASHHVGIHSGMSSREMIGEVYEVVSISNMRFGI